MSAIQLNFSLRTSPNVRSVHLLGSWDGYKSQLPLAMSKDSSVKPGTWKGTFRFQGSHALKLGSRYWYYYIVDGYHVAHDPAKESVTEKTTGRKLNILDVPSGKSTSSSKSSSSSKTSSSRHEVPKGRPVSPSRIACPKPSKPYASRQLREADYERSPVDEMSELFSHTSLTRGRPLADKYRRSPSDVSDTDSDSSGPTFSSSGSSSVSSRRSSCTCERYGVTRDGRRVKLDCGGARCGDDSSDCSSDSDSEVEYEHRRPAPRSSKPAPSRHAATRTVAVERRRR